DPRRGGARGRLERVPVRGSRLPRQHRGVLRPAQQLPERGHGPQAGHPDLAGGALHGGGPPRRAAARGRVVPGPFPGAAAPARRLRNLKAIYRETDKPERLLEVLNRMLVVAPDSSAELRDRGIVYQRLECYRAALKDLTDYLQREPDAPDLDEVRVRLMEVSA